MKIKSISCENFKSFKTLKMDSLENLNVFIGKNGSGKSNILDMLEIFFKDFDCSIDKEIGQLNEHI